MATIQNQKGITLIELLVTLAITSIIGVIIWSVFFQGNRYSQNSISKNAIQQEANLLITNLKKIHQTSEDYTITSSGCIITVNATKWDRSTANYEFKNSTLCMSLDNTGYFDPDNQDVPLKVTIYEIKNPNNKVEINTTLYRLKDGGI